jgi:CRISPR-associated protein Cmr3
MTRIGLRLDPLDPLLFRDGRPFDAATIAHSVLPTPQTLAGALRTALLAAWDPAFLAALRQNDASRADAPAWIIGSQFRGPWPALFDDRDRSVAPVPLLPTPATLVRDASERQPVWDRSRPQEPDDVPLPGWSPDGARWPLWRRALPDAKYPGGYLALPGIQAFLDGVLPDDAHFFEPERLYGLDARVGIEVDPQTLTSAGGRLYGVRLLALRDRIRQPGIYEGHRVGFYAEFRPPQGYDDTLLGQALAAPVAFGGEGHHVRAERVPAVAWPTQPTLSAATDSGRALWLLATPAFVGPRTAGGPPIPGRIPPHQLRAAASREPLAVSGWDVVRNGPRPTRFAVPAGSVYYVEGLGPLEQDSLCTDPEEIAQGWGFALEGAWSRCAPTPSPRRAP